MSEPFYDPFDRPDDDLTQEEFEAAMRPTPITDELRETIRELYKDGLVSDDGMGALLTDARRVESIERQLAEAMEEIERLKARIEDMEDYAAERNEQFDCYD